MADPRGEEEKNIGIVKDYLEPEDQVKPNGGSIIENPGSPNGTRPSENGNGTRAASTRTSRSNFVGWGLRKPNSFFSTSSSQRSPSRIGTFIQRFQSPKEQRHSSFQNEADKVARDEFFRQILDRRDAGFDSGSKTEYIWYARYLEGQFIAAWNSLLRPALAELTSLRAPGEIAVVYRALGVAAQILIGRREAAVGDIVKEFRDRNLLAIREEDEEDNDNVAPEPSQLAFAMVGWLTMLFEPNLQPSPNEIGMKRLGSTEGRRSARRSRTIIRYSQSFDNIDQPVYCLLDIFGALIPEMKVDAHRDSDLITVSNVCFAILDKVANVKIEWVNSLSLHLEFDNVRKTLRVFKFPSFCLLMYQMYQDKSLLSRLYLDHTNYFKDRGLDRSGVDLMQDYFREVLLSYRLLFGQDHKSWKAFQANITEWGENWNCSEPNSDDKDDLLLILCGKSYKSQEAREVYEQIDAEEDPKEELSVYYYPDSDFPFLGKRLLNLQAFVKGRHPHNWSALWNDRRNVAYWWTFWAVLIIGGCTIFLSLLQLVFSIWGSVTSQQQVWIGYQQNAVQGIH